MTSSKFKRTKFACYCAYFTMSSIFCLPPLLFVIFHNTYGVSWTLLGTLVLTNFCTQLLVDLIFTVFSKKFNVSRIVKIMPLVTSLGLLIYGIIPTVFPSYAYFGLLAGTVIFSISAGLSEVLLSPTIAAIPSDNPQRDMSLLHSLYAFGVFSVVVIGTLFIKFVGAEHWMYLTMFFAALPIIASVMFFYIPNARYELGHRRKRFQQKFQENRRYCSLRCLHIPWKLCRKHHVKLDLQLHGSRAAYRQSRWRYFRNGNVCHPFGYHENFLRKMG